MSKLRFILLSAIIIANLSISFAQDTNIVISEVPNDTLSTPDTISVPTQELGINDSLNLNAVDSLLSKTDLDSTASIDSLAPEIESSIKDIINYDAVDSILFNVAKQQAILYGRAHLDYDKLEVDAPTIIIDFKNNILEALADVDTNGKVIEYPVLKQGSDEFQAKVIKFNWTTDRGYIEDVYMKEGEGFVHANQAYLDEEKSMYVENASYTTCNLAKPHYHFKMQRAKVIPNDKIIASMVNLYIDDIPTPLGLPFGLFPAKDIRSSGVLLPSDFGEDGFGFFLKGFGYYWAISDKVSTKFIGEVYSKGTYGITNTTDYKVRYRYSGQINASYRDVATDNDEFGATSRKTYSLAWTHNPVSRNGKSLSARVRFNGENYNRLNLSDQDGLTAPNITSGINISTPIGKMFNSSISFNHNQKPSIDDDDPSENTFNLPNFTLGYVGESNLYKKLPYKKITPSKFRKNIMEQFKITYSMSGNNHASTSSLVSPTIPDTNYVIDRNPTDTVNLTLSSDDLGDIFRRNKFYMTHVASISNNLKLKAFTLTPSFNYRENWYFNQSLYNADTDNSVFSITEDPGFYRIARYSVGASLNTTFYNFYSVGRSKTKTIDGIEKTVDRRLKFRQTVQPSVSFSSSPDYSESEDVLDYVQFNEDSVAYNKYFLYQGRPSTSAKQRSVNFRLNNAFEMKLPTKWRQKEGEEAAKPISLLNLNASTSYNLAADSLKMSNIVITANNSRLLNGIASINATATFDPYQFDSTASTFDGVTTKSYSRVNKYWVEDNGFFARLMSLTIRSSLNLNPKVFKKKEPEGEDGKPEEPEEAENETNTSSYLDFSLPWTLRLGHSYTWTHSNPQADTTKINTMSIAGTIKLSEKWSTGLSVNYDIANKEFRTPNVSINRDLHCWQMSFTWVPFGPSYSRRYNFSIAVKAAMLKDLKYKKDSSPYNRSTF